MDREPAQDESQAWYAKRGQAKELRQEIVSKVPSPATRREHLTQSVVGTFARYPKIRARGQMTQLETVAQRNPSDTGKA